MVKVLMWVLQTLKSLIFKFWGFVLRPFMGRTVYRVPGYIYMLMSRFPLDEEISVRISSPSIQHHGPEVGVFLPVAKADVPSRIRASSKPHNLGERGVLFVREDHAVLSLDTYTQTFFWKKGHGPFADMRRLSWHKRIRRKVKEWLYKLVTHRELLVALDSIAQTIIADVKENPDYAKARWGVHVIPPEWENGTWTVVKVFREGRWILKFRLLDNNSTEKKEEK